MNDRATPLRASGRLLLGEFVLDLGQGELFHADGRIAGLRRQALQVLVVLGSRAGSVVTRDELMALVWPGVVVGDGSLVQAIADIRRTLGDRDHRLVRNVARRGYLLSPDAAHEPVLASTGAADAIADPTPTPSPLPAGAVGVPVPEAPAQEPVRTTSRRPRVLQAVLLLGIAAATLAGHGWWQGLDARGTATPPRTLPALSIVVLPFTADGDDGWFADVLHDDLTRELGSITGTVVISRETAARYRGADTDPRAIARDLGVRYVVHGTVRRAEARVRLSLAMADGRTGTQQWAEVFDLARAELPASLERVARRVARSLSVQMHRTTGQAVAELRADQVGADDIAMQGFSIYFRGVTPENMRAARERFEAALKLDPDAPRAWGGLQAVASIQGALGWVPRDQAVQQLQLASGRLDSLDPDSYYTHSARMFLPYLKGDWDALAVAGGAAAERFPSHPGPHIHLALAQAALGRFAECIASAGHAVRLGPRDYNAAIAQFVAGTCHFMRGEYRDAATLARVAHHANPALPSPPVLLAAALVRLGDTDAARAVAQEHLRRHPDYRATDIGKFLRGRDERYLQGRDRVIESLRSAGMP